MAEMMDKEEMYDKAFSYKNANKIDEAISMFMEIQNTFGEDNVSNMMIAMLYYYEKESKLKALPYAKKWVQLSPKSEKASLCLVHCLFDLEKQDELQYEIERYIKGGGKIDSYKILFEENGLSADDFIK